MTIDSLSPLSTILAPSTPKVPLSLSLSLSLSVFGYWENEGREKKIQSLNLEILFLS